MDPGSFAVGVLFSRWEREALLVYSRRKCLNDENSAHLFEAILTSIPSIARLTTSPISTHPAYRGSSPRGSTMFTFIWSKAEVSGLRCWPTARFSMVAALGAPLRVIAFRRSW